MATLHYVAGAGRWAPHIGSFHLQLEDSGAVDLINWRRVDGMSQQRQWHARVDSGVFRHLESLFRKGGRPVERPLKNLLPGGVRAEQQVRVIGGALDGWNLECDAHPRGEDERFQPLLRTLAALVEQASGYAIGNAARVALPVIVHDRESLEDPGWGSGTHSATVDIRCRVIAIPHADGRVVVKSFEGDTRLVLDTGVRGPVTPPCIASAELAGHDGLLVATGAHDGSVWAWDSSGRSLVRGWGARPGAVRQMADLGEGLVAIATDTGVIVWDAGQRREVARLLPQQGAVSAVSGVAGRGGWLALGGDDGMVRLWEVPEGRERFALSGHTGWVERLLSYGVDGGGTVLASGGADGAVRLWDPVEGTPLGASEERLGAVRPLHGLGGVTGRGPALLAAGHADGVLRLHDPGTGAVVAVVSSGGAGVECIASVKAADGDGQWLAAGRRDGQVTVWRVTGEVGRVEPYATAQLHEDWVTCLDIANAREGLSVTSGAIDGTRASWRPGAEPTVEASTQPLTLVAWDEPEGRAQAWGTAWGFVLLRRSDGQAVDLRQVGETGALAVVRHGGGATSWQVG